MSNNNIQYYDETMQEVQELPAFTVEDYEEELNYFQEYDQEMLDAVNQEVEEEEEEEEEEDYMMDESLLKLIVDVQTYLSEAPTDSPLFSLQYKMYTYLKQRALEMGMNIPSI